MPQDSVYINNVSADLEKLKDSLHGVLITPKQNDIQNKKNDEHGLALIIYLSVLFCYHHHSNFCKIYPVAAAKKKISEGL